MSTFSGYKTKDFSETQKFFVLDPNTGTPSFVLGSDLVKQLTPNSNYVFSEATRPAAQATDYPVGSLIQTAGAITEGDGLASGYLVVPAGEGIFPMDNGNELLVISGDDALREQLISSAAGEGSDLIAHTGTDDTVTEALDKRTIYVGSVAESFYQRTGLPDAQYQAIAWHPGGAAQVDPKGGGSFVFKADVPKSEHNGGTIISPTVPPVSAGSLASFLDGVGETDPSGTGVFVRIEKAFATPQMFGAVADGVTDDATSIQAVINAVLNVYFPAVGAFYFVGSRVTLRSHLRIHAEGDNSEVYLDNVDDVLFYANAQEDIVIQGIKAKGNQQYKMGTLARAFQFVDCKRIKLKDVETDSFNYGASFSLGIEDAEVIGCRFANGLRDSSDTGGYGVQTSGSAKNLLIRDNEFINLERHGVYISWSISGVNLYEGVKILNNFFDTRGIDANSCAIVVHNNALIQGNEIRHRGGRRAVEIRGTADGEMAPNTYVNVLDNTFYSYARTGDAAFSDNFPYFEHINKQSTGDLEKLRIAGNRGFVIELESEAQQPRHNHIVITNDTDSRKSIVLEGNVFEGGRGDQQLEIETRYGKEEILIKDNDFSVEGESSSCFFFPDNSETLYGAAAPIPVEDHSRIVLENNIITRSAPTSNSIETYTSKLVLRGGNVGFPEIATGTETIADGNVTGVISHIVEQPQADRRSGVRGGTAVTGHHIKVLPTSEYSAGWWVDPRVSEDGVFNIKKISSSLEVSFDWTVDITG